MNGRNYHMQYRRDVYRKKRIKLIAIISAISVVLLLALLLIIGTALNNKTYTYDPDEGLDSKDNVSQEPDSLPQAERVQARGLVLLTQDSSSLYSRVAALPSDTEAVCIRLNETDGTLLYRSSVADAISTFSVAENASRAETLFSTIQRRELYISAAIEMTALSETDDLLLPIMLSAYASMAAEVYNAGANDILLIAPMPNGEITTEATERLAEQLMAVAKQARSLSPNACIGFALPDAFLTSENSAEIISEMSEHFNYFSIDATNYGKEDPAEYLERRLGNSESADTQYYILRYGMRVLLPTVGDKELEDRLISIAEQYSSNNHNWQILP